MQPSWLSGLGAATISAGVVVATLIISNYQGSALQQELFEAKAGHASASVLGFRTITDNLAANPVVSNAPLFLFWAALGVVVYFFAAAAWNALTRAEELREELGYVNAPQASLMRKAAVNLLIRLLGGVLWLGYLELFLKAVFPYVLAAAHIAAVNPASPGSVGYAILAFTILTAALQAHVVFLRLIWLRLRLFGGAYSDTGH